MVQTAIIGVLTGVVSAVLFASASTGTMLGMFVLFFLSPLPVAIAGLGWGWTAAAVATGAGIVSILAFGVPRAALFYAAALGVPTAHLAYLLLLNRQTGAATVAGQPDIEWYPIGRVVGWATLWAGALATLAILTTATDLDGLRAAVRQTVERIVRDGMPMPGTSGKQAIGPAEITAMADLMALSMPGILASLWMAFASLNLWLAGHITRISARLSRPWPDLSAIQLPKPFPILFAIAIAGTFLGGYPALIASAFASAGFFAYMLIGLAILHHVTRGKSARGAILAGVYLALIILSPFSALAVAMVGVAEPLSPLRRTFGGPRPPGT